MIVNASEAENSLPMKALDNVPVPNPDAKQITALVKEGGKVSGYQLSDGAVISKEEGVELAKAGGISGVGISHRNGVEYLKSFPDNTESNNLSQLPTMKA